MPKATHINSSIVKKLYLPPPGSHKGQNGRLLVIAGSKRFLGSLVYALKVASRIVDLIYVLTTKENQDIISKLKTKTAEFIPAREFGDYVDYVDCILIGPGMGPTRATKKLVTQALKCGKKVVLDADALNVLDKNLMKFLHPNVILTPHKREFKRVFGIDPNSTIVQIESIKYNCTIVLKGRVDVVASRRRVGLNYTGNQGMTKGGTGDLLAGLIAAFFCKNDAYLSAAAGAFLNGKAGDDLYHKIGPYYNAEDLVEQIPKTQWNLVK